MIGFYRMKLNSKRKLRKVSAGRGLRDLQRERTDCSTRNFWFDQSSSLQYSKKKWIHSIINVRPCFHLFAHWVILSTQSIWLWKHGSQRKTVGQRRGIINHVRLFEESRKLCLRKWESVGRGRSLGIEESQFVRFQLKWSVTIQGIQFASASFRGNPDWVLINDTSRLFTNSSFTSRDFLCTSTMLRNLNHKKISRLF